MTNSETNKQTKKNPTSTVKEASIEIPLTLPQQ